MNSQSANPVVMITGASSGLGLAIAQAWAKQGARVVLVARDAVKLQAAAERLNVPADHYLICPTDITNEEAVQVLFEQVQQHWGQLDVLVNCAGVSMRGTIADTPLSEFQRLWELNVLALLRCVQAAIPLLRKSHGTIVNIGSLASKIASKYYGAYPATKHAVAAISQQLRLELKDDQIGVLLVCPGPIQRADSAPRYQEQAVNLPSAAQQAGGGVKLSGIDPTALAEQIIKSVARDSSELVWPGRARWLFAIYQLSPSWGDWLLSKFMRS